MGQKNTEEIQQFLLSMYKDINQAFAQNGLHLIACGGTCLGAIRHNGFIPWDDDMDFYLIRDEYNFLLDHYKDILPDKYELFDCNRAKHCEILFLKIHNKNTTFVEDKNENYKDRTIGVFLDIFPLDGLPNDSKSLDKHKKRLWWYSRCNFKIRMPINTENSLAGVILHLLLYPIKLIKGYDFFSKKWSKKTQEYDIKNSALCAYTGFNNVLFPFATNGIYEMMTFPFEDTYINVIKNYDEYMTLQYGDYMKLPPKEEQVGIHGTSYINFDLPYRDYIKSHFD